MAKHYPVVLEHQSNGTVSAHVIGVPGVFAAADTERAAATAIRGALEAHLAATGLPAARRRRHASLWVAKIMSARRAAAARATGQKGGRPRRTSHG